MTESEEKNLNEPHFLDDEIDLKELIGALWSQKLLIIACTVVVSSIALIYALSLPNIYTSKAILASAQQSQELSNSFRGYSGLASLAGINLPSSSSSNEMEAIETLSSYKFFKNSFLPNIFLPDLMAVKSWDAKTNILIYDKSLYDNLNNEWVRKVTFPKNTIPSAQEAFGVLKEKFSLFKDEKTGFVTISVEHQSPYVAKAWLDTIIFAINQTFREDQKRRASLSVEYLNKQIAKTSYAEIKKVLSALVQKETEKLMLIEANEDYIFKVIDPPIAPEFKSKPMRTFICFIGLLLGVILGAVTALGRYYLVKK